MILLVVFIGVALSVFITVISLTALWEAWSVLDEAQAFERRGQEHFARSGEILDEARRLHGGAIDTLKKATER